MAEDRNQNEDPLLGLMAAGIMEPRPTMARVLGMELDEGARLAMVAFSVALSGIGYALTGGITSGLEAAGFPPVPAALGYFALIFGALLQYLVFSGLINRIGGAIGGKADAQQSRTTAAWWMFATAPLQLLQAVAIGIAPPPLASLVMFGTSIFMLWLLAAYVTEAHGFQSTGMTFGVVVGVSLVIAMILSSFLAGMMPEAIPQ